MGALQPRFVNKACRRINVPGSADGDKDIALGQRKVDLIHIQRHLAEPHHVRAQRRGELAAVAFVLRRHIAGPRQHLAAPRAAHLQQLAVHMNHPAIARALVQIIDILGDQQKTIAQYLFQPRQRLMRRVGRNVRTLQLTTAVIVKRLHQRRIAGEAFRRRHVFHPMLFPQAIGGAEGFNSRLCRNTRAG